MKFLSVALAVLASASLAGAQNQNKYLCPAGATNETITVKNKAKLQFLVAKKTAHNMSCEANYVMETCSRVKLACKFKLNGRGKACSGDQALVTANGKTTTLCKGKKGKYSANVNGDFSIKVVTDGKKPSKGGKCTIRCTKKAKPTTTTAAPTPPPTTAPPPTSPSGGGGGGTTLPNPGGAAYELTLEVEQTWTQEAAGYTRTAKVAVPATSAGQKVPVVFHLHGNGGQGDTRPFGNFLGDDCIIVAPDGYERSWNIYSEASKADDVQFILDLIAKVGAEIPAADMENVNIAGTSNGAALTYQILINTGADRPFRRAFPMVSSLIGPQFHDDQFWTFAQSAAGDTNVFSVSRVPTFADNFEYAHFHGTEDPVIKYDGQKPGPAFLSNAEVISAQLTDYIWARAMGFTGSQLADSDGVDIGTDDLPTQEYKYLNGRCRHYKLIGEGHGTGPNHDVAKQVLRDMIFSL